MILEANLNYPSGASFHTMVQDLLGKVWSSINRLSITFVLYILTYAYISAGGSIIAHTLQNVAGIGQTSAGFIFALLVAFIVVIHPSSGSPQYNINRRHGYHICHVCR